MENTLNDQPVIKSTYEIDYDYFREISATEVISHVEDVLVQGIANEFRKRCKITKKFVSIKTKKEYDYVPAVDPLCKVVFKMQYAPEEIFMFKVKSLNQEIDFWKNKYEELRDTHYAYLDKK